jgi:hypothetical protein
MLNKIVATTLLAVSATVFAGASGDSAVIGDSDKIITLAMDTNTWSYAAAAPKGLSKVREFHDMGAAGVQQIDYVVNCTTGKLALASFKVLTAMSSDVGQAAEPTIGSVSYYKPVIQHDMKILENVCGSSMAAVASQQMN